MPLKVEHPKALPKAPLNTPARLLGAVAVLALGTFVSAATAGPIRSVGAMTFVDADTVVIADWRGAEIHALHLSPVTSAAPKPFNLTKVPAPIARALRTRPDKLRFEDMAFRPGAELAYITVSVDQGATAPRPALVSIDAVGKVAVVDLLKTRRTSAEIKDRPAADKRLWRDVPEAAYTVTELVFHEGKLYVAGLSNASFASTLRVYDFPFTGATTATSVEMYHAVHDQLETRAPIRKMAIATLNGEPILLHPGRVKSSVGPNVARGRALSVGSTVRLVVEHPALAHPLIKVWTVTAFDAQPPQPERWSFQGPRPHSRDALMVHVGEPISSSAEALIAVRGPQGQRVAGRSSLENGETLWRFTPSRPWRAGTYAVVTHPDLEDPAGNRACAAFERVHASVVRCDAGSTIPFEVLRGPATRGE